MLQELFGVHFHTRVKHDEEYSKFGENLDGRRRRHNSQQGGAENDPGFFGVEAAWIPLDTNISPYVSGALGVVSAAHDGDGTALGTKLEVGAEFFRLHGARLFVGASAVIPFENLAFTDTASFGAVAIPRSEYLRRLVDALETPVTFGEKLECV